MNKKEQTISLLIEKVDLEIIELKKSVKRALIIGPLNEFEIRLDTQFAASRINIQNMIGEILR